MAILLPWSGYSFLDRQTGEGAMPRPKQSQEEKNRQWEEAWHGKAEAGRTEGQAPSGEPTEDRQGQPGRSGATQSTEEEVT